MATNEANRTHEILTPAERDDVLVTLAPSDLLEFVQHVMEHHPDTYDQVVDHFTRRVWVGGRS